MRKNESAVGKLKFELVDSFTQLVGMAQLHYIYFTTFIL